MMRKIVYDREWLEKFAPKYLAAHEYDIGGRVVELTMLQGEVPIETEFVDNALIEVDYTAESKD